MKSFEQFGQAAYEDFFLRVHGDDDVELLERCWMSLSEEARDRWVQVAKTIIREYQAIH